MRVPMCCIFRLCEEGVKCEGNELNSSFFKKKSALGQSLVRTARNQSTI